MITPAQIRGARAMLDMKQTEVASAAGVSLATLNNIERGVSDPKASTLSAIRRALEAAGVEFTRDGGVRRSTDLGLETVSKQQATGRD